MDKPQWMIDHEEHDRQAFEKLNEKIDAHMESIKPYLQGAAGLGLIWKLFMVVGGAALLYAQVKQNFWH